jgi:hypothetical protein
LLLMAAVPIQTFCFGARGAVSQFAERGTLVEWMG